MFHVKPLTLNESEICKEQQNNLINLILLKLFYENLFSLPLSQILLKYFFYIKEHLKRYIKQHHIKHFMHINIKLTLIQIYAESDALMMRRFSCLYLLSVKGIKRLMHNIITLRLCLLDDLLSGKLSDQSNYPLDQTECGELDLSKINCHQRNVCSK